MWKGIASAMLLRLVYSRCICVKMATSVCGVLSLKSLDINLLCGFDGEEVVCVCTNDEPGQRRRGEGGGRKGLKSGSIYL
jgi:hypothetical protein